MTRRRLAFLAVAAVFVLLFGGRWVALCYTEHLWFAALGQGERWRWLFLRALGWQTAVFAASFGWYAAHTLGVYGSIGSVQLPRRLGNLEIDEAVPSRTLRGIALAVAAVLALATTYTFADLDQYVALARSASPYGHVDPVLSLDAAHYMAVLPLLEVLHLLASVATILASLLVVGLYGLTGSFAVSRRRVRITPHARTHLIVMLAALALVVAWGFHLDAYQMVAGGGHANGALSPADRTIRIPASNALAVIGLMVALGSALALRWVRPPLLFGLWATLGVAALLGRFVLPVMTEAWGAAGNPALVQQVSELDDAHSRLAFGLLDVPTRVYTAGPVLPESGAALAQAVDGVYAWSAEPGLPTRLLETELGDTSRIRVWTATVTEARDAAGRLTPAAIAVPQTDVISAMREVPRPRWTPLHRGALAWGGEPLALDARLRAGRLRYLSSLVPADSAAPGTPLRREAGRVRFLPRAAEMGVVGPDESTVGEPAPGILLSGVVRRLLLAWALQAPPLLDDHTSNADRALYWRDLPSRLSRLYPFAGFDPARAALLDGRLVWISDGFLVSARFPLAETIRWRGELVNHLSAPYVVTVDAVDGETRFYLRRGANAFAASVARSAAVAPLPADSMPPALRRALRYPSGLLAAQAAMLALRGERDDRGAVWSLAWQDTAVSSHDAAMVPPTLALLALDGPVRPWELVPIVNQRGGRLGALVAGTASDQGQLRLALLRVEGSDADAPTPQAAAGRIATSPALLSAAAASGPNGAPGRGPMLVIPAAGTIVYAQLLTGTTPRSNIPTRIEGVSVLAGGRVGFGTTGADAVRALQHGESQNLVTTLVGAELVEARAAFLALDSARQAGDWERFGQAWASLRRALRLDTGGIRRP